MGVSGFKRSRGSVINHMRDKRVDGQISMLHRGLSMTYTIIDYRVTNSLMTEYPPPPRRSTPLSTAVGLESCPLLDRNM